MHIEACLRFRTEGTCGKEQGVAWKKGRHDQTRLREDDQKKHTIGPQTVAGYDFGEVFVDVEDEIHQLLEEVDHGGGVGGSWRAEAIKKADSGEPAWGNKGRFLDVGLGFAQTLDAIAFLPLSAFLEDFDAFKTLQNVALDDDTAGALEAFVL